MRANAIALSIALLLVAGPGWAQSTAGARSTAAMLGDKFFRVEFEPGTAKSGRPLLSGYVYNDNGLAPAKVRLFVESLDPAGQVTATTVGYVDWLVPLKGRAYFEVPLDRPAASYRVSVPYFDWIEGRGNDGFLR